MLAVLIIVVGWLKLYRADDFNAMAWVIILIAPGTIGFILAVLALVAQLITVIAVASPYLAVVSCVVTVSGVVYISMRNLFYCMFK